MSNNFPLDLTWKAKLIVLWALPIAMQTKTENALDLEAYFYNLGLSW